MADVPTVSWSETSPARTDNIALGDNRIREAKTQIREVIDVDHDFPSSGKASDVGQHKRVTLQEQADLGTGATGVPILGAQTIAGKPELVYTDEDNNDIQLTSVGKIKLSSGRLENNVYLTARNRAGDGDINLIKVNASNQAEITPALVSGGGTILPEISTPTTTANQGALYTKNDGDQTELYFREESNGDEVQSTNGGVINQIGLGSWVDKSSSYGAQQASTDGFVVCLAEARDQSSMVYQVIGYTDSSADPTTQRASIKHNNQISTANPVGGSFTMPVKKRDYWKVVRTVSGSFTDELLKVYWIPLGS